jgi:hypothetical protein
MVFRAAGAAPIMPMSWSQTLAQSKNGFLKTTIFIERRRSKSNIGF